MTYMLNQLAEAIAAHKGTFECVEIYKESKSKQVSFRHLGTPPNPDVEVLPLPGLEDFYATFGSLTMYLDSESGDAAYYIATPAEWAQLDEHFRPWLDGVEPHETDEYIPGWVEDCIVVGEIPRSGNYLLVALSGPEVGMVFEFEHDGFEFIELAKTLPEFVLQSLDLDERRLTNIASHLRFITDGSDAQWWISELRDNRGNVVRTEV
jgi:hypothetical protein